jgi:hypothetical protein
MTNNYTQPKPVKDLPFSLDDKDIAQLLDFDDIKHGAIFEAAALAGNLRAVDIADWTVSVSMAPGDVWLVCDADHISIPQELIELTTESGWEIIDRKFDIADDEISLALQLKRRENIENKQSVHTTS